MNTATESNNEQKKEQFGKQNDDISVQKFKEDPNQLGKYVSFKTDSEANLYSVNSNKDHFLINLYS